MKRIQVNTRRRRAAGQEQVTAGPAPATGVSRRTEETLARVDAALAERR